ncbi:MAG TPA: hypothetical protein VGQ76_19710 [Thermoanaerobaculia bacterium]|nr:hypothetical protein [Thermoanaerobaculia bacterium]
MANSTRWSLRQTLESQYQWIHANVLDDWQANQMLQQANLAYVNCKKGDADDIPRRIQMNSRQQLTPEEHRQIIALLEDRMARTLDEDWRRFWETEILFLNGADDRAVVQLELLSTSQNQNVVVAALMSLGEWYRSVPANELARTTYQQAILVGGPTSAVLPRIRLAELYNEDGEVALAIAVLQEEVQHIESIPEDTVQFVATEYCQALRQLHRDEEARAFLVRVKKSFPWREEIAQIEQRLFGDVP